MAAKKKADPNDIIIGQNLRRLRLARDISQEVLGKGLKLTFQQVQKYEKGTNRMGGSRIVQVCNLLHCGLNDLFAGTDLKANGKALPDEGLAFLGTTTGRDIAKNWHHVKPETKRTISDLVSQAAKE
jgi:transcriptional regulator with XRE-family HTH domain